MADDRLPETTLRVGIVGCGMLGVIHAERFARIPGVAVTALCDPSEQARARAAAAAGRDVAVSVSDHRRLLESDLDIVCIATPDSMHVGQVLDALDRRMHVLCEKPLTPDPAELQSVIDAVRRTGRIVTMTYPRRYDGRLRAMRREILSGRWGRVKTITLYFAEDWVTPNVGTWRHDPATCPGGFFYDSNGHQLDTTFWLTGLEGVSVRAQSDDRGTGVPIWTWGTARLTQDVPMTFSFVGDAKNWREHMIIHCEGRDFRVENMVGQWSEGSTFVNIEPADPEETADESVVRTIREGKPNWSPPTDIWPVLRFTRAALVSAKSGAEATV